jgi:segregation and condensation protein B
MSLKAKIEAIIYAAEEPITADQIAEVLKAELAAIADNDDALSGDAAVQESLGEGQAEALAPAEQAFRERRQAAARCPAPTRARIGG